MIDEVIAVADAQQAAALMYADDVSPLDEPTWRLHRPAVHLAALRHGRCVGRCSIWHENTPELEGMPTGFIGHYAAADASAGYALLNRAAAALADRGSATAVGPVDGSTWRCYRLVTWRGLTMQSESPPASEDAAGVTELSAGMAGVEPPFFLEPDNPDDWPAHFTGAGFSPLARYFSSLNDDLSRTDPRVPAALQRLREAGITLRTIDLARFESELRAVHALSTIAFARNFLYTPIDADEFLAMYAPLRPLIRPELVLLAEAGGQLIGFIFGLPDLLEIRRGEPSRTAIAKSMAVAPGRSGAGLGSVLMDLFHQAARKLGYQRVIHALMHEDNLSRKITGRFGRTIRQYTLFAKALRP